MARAFERKELDQWMAEHQEDGELADHLFEAAAVAFMAGQLFVRDVELAGTIKLDTDRDPPVLEMTFQEALELFTAREVVDPETFYSDVIGIRQRSFTATRLMTETLRRRAFEEIGRTIREGGTVQDFVTAIETEQTTLGMDPSDRSYLRTVFHTNMASAYGAGRFVQITHPDVMAARPFVQYRAILDEHTRDEHRALNGTVYRTDDPVWHDIAPPNDFNCRCAFLTLDAEEAAGLDVLDAVPEGLGPAEFFEGPPTAALEV